MTSRLAAAPLLAVPGVLLDRLMPATSEYSAPLGSLGGLTQEEVETLAELGGAVEAAYVMPAGAPAERSRRAPATAERRDEEQEEARPGSSAASTTDLLNLTGGPLLQTPRWTGGGRLTWQPTPRISLRFNARARSWYFDRQYSVPDRNSVDGYGLLGFAGSWRVHDGLTLRARLDNATNEAYETHGATGMAVRR